MRVLTVQQPWAWAIVHGGKSVENRTQAWSYRGPLAIHAGLREDLGALNDATMWEAMRPYRHAYPTADPVPIDTLGAVLGVVDLVDVHVSSLGREVTSRARPGHGLESHRLPGCCSSPWAQYSEGPTKPVVHLVLENPRPLSEPIPARGRLGLWTPDVELLDRIREQVPA